MSGRATAQGHALGMLAAMVAGVVLDDLRVLVGLGLASLGAWIWRHRDRGWTPGRFGVANSITALRVALVASLATLGPERLVPWGGVLVLVVFALDGLDGRWARRSGTATPFGAAFDQEADAFLVAVVCVALVLAELAPGWILLTGALRYGYVLVVHTLRLRGEAPRSTIARYVFAVLVIAMIAVMIFPGRSTSLALKIATAMLVWSFGRSLWWSWRGPAPEGRP